MQDDWIVDVTADDQPKVSLYIEEDSCRTSYFSERTVYVALKP